MPNDFIRLVSAKHREDDDPLDDGSGELLTIVDPLILINSQSCTHASSRRCDNCKVLPCGNGLKFPV